MQRLLVDLRYAARQLTRSPGFTLAVTGILALGTGTTAAVVAAVDHVLFRPLNLPDSEQIITLCEVRESDRTYCSVSPPNLSDWLEQANSIRAGGIARQRTVHLEREQGRVSLAGAMATPGYLEAVGVAPLHGRLLQQSDMLPQGSANVMVLAYETWQEQFGGEPNIVGRTVHVSSDGDGRVLHNDPVTIVGVLPPLEVPRLEGTRAWIPLQIDGRAEEHRGWRGFISIARLAPGVDPGTAAVEINRIQSGLARTYPEDLESWSVEVHRLREYVVKDARPLLLLFLGAVGVVLAIVSVNLVTLLLSRATQREREFTVLAALGAGQGRLARQLIMEALLLALGGGALGILLATWLTQGFLLLAPAGIPRAAEIAMDTRIVLLMTLVSVAIGLFFGAAPALRLRHARLDNVLREGRTSTGGVRRQRARRVLVVVQLALSLALLLSAALLTRSFARLASWDPGFELNGLLTFQVYPSMARYDTREKRRELYGSVESALRALPGVVAVGSASSGPLLGGGDGRTPFIIAGSDVAAQDAPTTEWFDAGPGYFPTLGVPVLLGRNLAADAGGDVVEALINETMARRYWPGASPVGARLELPDWGVQVEVVGVVADLRSPDELPASPSIYVNNVQRPRGASFFVVRTATDPAALSEPVRAALAELDREIVPQRVMTLRELLQRQLVAPRFNVVLMGLFALLSLVLATAGVYALIAYTVTLRKREFGVRLALGARASQILTGVLVESGKLLGAGLALGGVFAFFFTRLLRSFVQDVGPADTTAMVIAVGILVVAALSAATGPALRGARTPPAVVLRSD